VFWERWAPDAVPGMWPKSLGEVARRRVAPSRLCLRPDRQRRPLWAAARTPKKMAAGIDKKMISSRSSAPPGTFIRGPYCRLHVVHGVPEPMVRQGKSLLRVTVERWGPAATGGFPPDAAPAG